MSKTQDQFNDQVSKIIEYSTTQFDKTLLLIASGSLGLSLTFIKDMVPNLATSLNIEWLHYSWFLFTGVIFGTLLMHLTSMFFASWTQQNQHEKSSKVDSWISRFNYIIWGGNILLTIANFIGMLLLVLFVKLNSIPQIPV